MARKKSTTAQFPTLPLRDMVVYPGMVLPLFVGRPKSVAALNVAMEQNEQVFLLAQQNGSEEEPSPNDLHEVGTVANILQVLKLPDGTVKLLVEGSERAAAVQISDTGEYLVATVEMLSDTNEQAPNVEALRRTLLNQFDQYVKANKKISNEVVASIHEIENNGRLTDTVSAHLQLKLEQRQKLLALADVVERMEFLLAQIEGELEIAQLEKRIRGKVKRQMDKNQRDYYLNEQIKVIQKELGGEEDSRDFEKLAQQIQDAGMSKEAEEKAMSELRKLKMMPPMSSESTVVRNYIETLIELPWKKKTRISKDLTKADLVLNEDHYGLEKVKERILEYLAVQKRTDKLKGPILCLVGPPGVGKTSLGESIAKATGRKYVRMALGGVKDESEIRGHRRTYIGSMPGKIMQSMTKVGVKNPLFLLDEIDKLGNDFRGDPAAALLEVLDPEQNSAFADHFVEVDFDLSDVMFIATSNSFNIPPALLDRMEIIRLSGYTEDEKINIAMQYLVPKQMKRNGVKDGELAIDETAVRDIVRYYTREAGVRSLDREIAKICRKAVIKNELSDSLKAKKPKVLRVDEKNLGEFLGVRPDVAMTGEITLRGEVLPIGGLKEKLLAALRGGIKHVLIPKDNVKDLEEIPQNVKDGLEIHAVQWIDEVFVLGLEKQPAPYVADEILPENAIKVQAASKKPRTPRQH
ncbi:Lon protease [Kingella kingae]|uniref:endopeptidase La n=1 Tax=Kingella kingae TaxID=504 RepID=UPI000E073850|nr:endopeptidase La [Kingella kingae]QIP47428.1 endopeptidase La [Kingella kingae]STR03901.1 Lon protease [Kingella kingae]